MRYRTKVGDTINAILLGASFTFLFLTINQTLVARVHSSLNVYAPIQHITVEVLTIAILSITVGRTIYLLTNLKAR